MITKKRTGFEGGLWIIPTLLFLAGVYSIVFRAIPQWKSGSCVWTKVNGIDKFVCDETIRVGFFSIGATIFGLAFLAAALASYLLMRSER